MNKSFSGWILESDEKKREEPLKEVCEHLRHFSIFELTSIWRAVVAELKNRVSKTEAAIF